MLMLEPVIWVPAEPEVLKLFWTTSEVSGTNLAGGTKKLGNVRCASHDHRKFSEVSG